VLYLIVAVLFASARADAQSAAKTKPRPVEISTDHLKIRYVSEVVVPPGEVASLIVEIEPRQGMHVYAPGADDYQVITVTLDKHASIQARPIKYPPSELYLFAPLNEQIPVYQKPFALIVEATVANVPRTLALKGRFEYQACDDKVCFAPVEVPLSWTISR
jgi:DsbC/DsbD-like thiol-disulfide interchange protein